jgi:N-sulfoglucosamine sulfohydrolase
MRHPPLSRFLTLLALVLSGTLSAKEPSAAKPALNFLWLIAEDFSPHLGCYGETLVQTPNLDRMAEEGMKFTRAFTTAPVCSPSRSAFMTGMYQTTIGAHHHRSHLDDGYQLPAPARLITERMREAGYFTANLVELPGALGFQGTGKTDFNFYLPSGPTAPKPKDPRNHQSAFDSSRWSDLKSHQPFLAQINFKETHRPFHGPTRIQPDQVQVPPIYPDHPVTRADWARYLDDACELDRKIGAVLQALKDEGLAEHTVVLFMADHGMAHVRGKQFCYDDGLRIPLLIRWPDAHPLPAGFQPGTTSDRIIEAIDIAPTLLSLVQKPKPDGMQGRIFLGPFSEPPREFAFAARDRCGEALFRLRTARDSRFRYIRNFMPEVPFFEPSKYKETAYPVWNLIQELGKAGRLTPWQESFYLQPLPTEELYDMDADPWSQNNLVSSQDPAHQQALARLRGALDRWLAESDDQGRFPEPPEVTARSGYTRLESMPSRKKR